MIGAEEERSKVLAYLHKQVDVYDCLAQGAKRHDDHDMAKIATITRRALLNLVTELENRMHLR